MDATPLENLIARKDALEKVLSRIDVWLLIFGVFVVIGVAGESIFGIRAWWNNRKLHSVQESINDLRQAETSRFNREAGDARKDAAQALERAAKAEENLGNSRRDAAAANERAALAEQHTAELQASLKPRRLTAEQKVKLISILKPFSSLPITLEWVGSGTQEVADLASDMFDTITSAGITIPNKNILMDVYLGAFD